MISALAILLLLIALSFSIWHLRKSARNKPADGSFFNGKQNEIDVEILSLLLSREEDDYLRESLSDGEFRRTKRQRVSLAWKYLDLIGKNSRHLIQIVESARSSNDPQVARAANDLLQMAFRVRMNLPIVQLSLLTEWLWPTLRLHTPLKIDRYREIVKTAVFILQRLEGARSEPLSQVGNGN